MQTKRILAPSFINKIDRYLLLNKPEAWSARTHMVVYYGILFIALLAGIAFIVPDDPRTPTPAAIWTGFVSLISLVAMVGWVIYLLRFNVFKRYGLSGPADRLMTFVLYFISIGMFVLFCFVEPFVETVRANNAYTEEEIVKDMNTVNRNILRLEYDSLEHDWPTTIYQRTAQGGLRYDTITRFDGQKSVIAGVDKEMISKDELQDKLDQADSSRKLNDSMFAVLSCPDYIFVSPYKLVQKEGVLSSKDFYYKEIVHYTPPANKKELRDELKALSKKYKWQQGNTYGDYDRSYDETSTRGRIELRYDVDDISDSMNNILERKHRWDAIYFSEHLRMFFYPAFALALLVFAFRHTTAKTFFLTILAGIVLLILGSLFLAFSGYSERGIYGTIWFYFVLSIIFSLSAFFTEKRNAAAGIATNIFLWLLPFIPLITVVWYYRNWYETNYPSWEKHDFELEGRLMLWAEIGGIILLLLMIATYFHKVYRRWYAAPES